MKQSLCVGVVMIILGTVFVSYKSSNNICKTFADYYSNRDSNENCYYNPDYDLTVPDIIQRHGYPVETYYIATKDGYILTLFRIPHGRNSPAHHQHRPGKPVFLQHGLGSNSGCFINRGQKSLGFILANKGYDVWLGNSRGTIYARNHTDLNDTDSKFWEFTFHENGIYDLPAQIGFTRNVTGQKMIYIGYSQSTISMYVYSSIYPKEAAEQISMFINLAPSAYLKHNKSVMKYVLRYWPLLAPAVQFITGGQIFSWLHLPSLLKYLCYPFPFQLKLCQIPEMLLFGFSYGQNDPETLPISFVHNVDWCSVKQFTHIVQLSHSDNFQNYDYGSETNMLIYGELEPPHYNLSKVSVPTYFIRAENDLVTTKENVEKLYYALPEKVRPYNIYVIPDEEFSHIDFVAGKDVVPLVYDHIIEFIRNLS